MLCKIVELIILLVVFIIINDGKYYSNSNPHLIVIF